MASFKSTNKKLDSVGVFKATEKRSYDPAMVSSWERRSKAAYDTMEQYRKRINSGGFLSTEDLANYRSALDAYKESASNLRRISKSFGQTVDDDEQWGKSLAQMEDSFKGISDYYSQWKTDVDYKVAMDQAKANAQKMAELTGGYDPATNQQEGRAGWDAYVAQQEKYAQMNKESMSAQEDPGFWEQLLKYIGDIGSDTSLPGLGGSQVTAMSKEAQQKDLRMRSPDERWTDEQRETFGYLWNTERQKANEYAFAINSMLDKQTEDAKVAKIAGAANNSFLSGTVNTLGALVTAPFGLADYLGDLISQGAVGYIPQADGEITPFEYSQAVTGGISQNLNDRFGTLNENVPVIGGAGLGDVYGLGTSIAQSSLAAFTGGSGQALVQFFGSAAASGVDDAIRHGASGEKAIAYGAMLGLAEGIAENIGVDNLMRIGSASTMRQLVGKLLKQGAAEGLEEGITSLMNNFSDNLFLRDKSNFNALVDRYMKSGMSESDAKKQAWLDIAEGVAFDMLGGFVSGGVHAAPVTTYQTVTQNAQAKQLYGGSQQELVGKALEIDPNNAFAQKMQGRLDGGKNLSGGQLAELARQNDAAIMEQDVTKIQKAVEARLTELGETGDVAAIAAALTKQAQNQVDYQKEADKVKRIMAQYGVSMAEAIEMADQTERQELSRAEEKLIAGSKYGQLVANELNPKNIRSGKYSAEWAQKIGTQSINAVEYGRLLEDAQLPEATAENTAEQVAAEAPKAVQAATVEPVEVATTDGEIATASVSHGLAMTEVAEESSETPEAAEEPISLEEASKKYGAQAGAMVHTYTAGQDVAAYDKAYKAAYDMGKSGVSLDYVQKSQSASYLTDAQKELAYEAGKAASITDAQAHADRNKEAANGKTGRRKGTVKGEGVKIADLKKTFNDPQGRAYKYLSTVAEVTGIDIVLYRSEAGADGEFQGAQGRYSRIEPGTIYIDLNAGLTSIDSAEELAKYSMLRTFSHEFTHFIENWNPVQYNEFRKVVFDTLTQRGENVHDLIEEKQARNPGMEYEAASREVVAEAMTDILPDVNFVQELAQKHKNIFTKLLEKLKEFAANLREYFDSISEEANALKEQVGETVKYVDSIVQLWDKVAVEAVENYQQTVATEEVAVAENATTEKDDYGFTISDNVERGSLEISFDSKPSDEVRHALKEHKFRWHKVKKVWFGFTDRQTITDALHKAYEAENAEPAAAAPEQSDFEKAFWNASQAERDEVVEAINQNTKITHMAPTEIRESVDVVQNEEVTINGENADNQGAVQQPVTDGSGAAPVLDELQTEDVQGNGGSGNTVGNPAERGQKTGRDGNQPDSQRSGSGSGSGSGQSGDLRGSDRVTSEDVTDTSASEQLHEEVAEQIAQQSTEQPKGRNYLNEDENYEQSGIQTGTDRASGEHQSFPGGSGGATDNGRRDREDTRRSRKVEAWGTLSVKGRLGIVNAVKSQISSSSNYDEIRLYLAASIGKPVTEMNLADKNTAVEKLARSLYESITDLNNSRPLVEQRWSFMGNIHPIIEAIYGENVQFQQRTNTLTDREVLAIAANQVKVDDLTDAEKSALDIFQQRLSKLEDLQTKRAEQGQLYKEQQFGANVNRAAAAETLNRMHVLDSQIQRASAEVLSVEEKTVLKRVLQKARKVVEQQERQRGQEILNRWRDRRDNAAAIKKYRDRIRGDVDELTNWVLHPDNKSVVKHIPDALKKTVIPFLSSIDFTSKQQLRGGKPTIADKAFMEKLRKLDTVMSNTGKSDDMYSNYTDLPPDFEDKLHEFVNTAQGIVDNSNGEFVINQMTAEELHDLSSIVRTLKKHIMQMNRFHVNAMFKHVYEAGDNSIDFLAQMKPAENTGTVSQFLLWQQMRPAYAFERFGEGGKAIYDGLRRGQAKLAFNTKTIKAFSDKAYTEAEVKAWENEVKTIPIGPGKTVTMRVSQIMSLYELNKREQARGHILGEGIRVATFKNGKQKISDVGQRLTPGELNLILRELTPRQKEVADNLQQFMQKQGGEWGNHVTIARFGEKQFGEENYFPINSDGRHLSVDADEKPGAAALYALLNMSFTKQTQEKATNRIIVYSIFDVFANHMASVAQYNAFALPVVDALKWFNYQQVDIDENGSKTILGSVREQMDRAYGAPEETRPGSGRRGYAQNFVINIIKAFNGTEAQGTPNDTLGLQTLHHYNRAQVAYNFRVVVQQPLAITRAALLLDYASIIKGMKLSPAAIQKNIQEMQSYSGIAAWKSLGFYDVNISRGLTSIIKHNDTWLDKVNDVGMWGAEKADIWTWAAIWSASKEEVIRKQHLTPNSEGFYEAVTKLFEDVIYKTQVVDSVLTKNEFMRDKGFFARAVGSFMSEPSATASMLVDAYDKFNMDMQRGMTRQQAWKKNSQMIVRLTYVYGIGAAILAAVQAVADALRDDDDYQEWYEKWLEAFGGNLLDELMPFNKVPIVSDFYDLAKELLSVVGVDTYGSPPQSVFMQWYDSLVKGTEILYDKISGANTNYTWYGGGYKLLQALSGMTGLPMAAATREIITVWNNIVGGMAPSLKVKTYEPSEKSQIKYAYQDGYLTEEEAIAQLIKQGIAKNEYQARKIVREW